jgi:hypothetical protein
MVRVDVVVEVVLAVVLPQQRPCDVRPALNPEADPPLVLASLVLARAPGDIADMPARAHAQQPTLLEGELLHRGHDLGRQTHERIIGA